MVADFDFALMYYEDTYGVSKSGGSTPGRKDIKSAENQSSFIGVGLHFWPCVIFEFR